MSHPKRTTHAVQQPPASGRTDAGVPFDPMSSVPEPSDVASAKPPRDRAMPAPQSPLPAGEIERLKARAAKTLTKVLRGGQPDPSAERTIK